VWVERSQLETDAPRATRNASLDRRGDGKERAAAVESRAVFGFGKNTIPRTTQNQQVQTSGQES
jgi:hypothetical protein